MNPIVSVLFAIIVGLAYASLCEWILHRFVMHRPWKYLRYPFRAHAQIHHQLFKADDTYHLQNEKDKELIPMAWWNGPALVLIFQTPWMLLTLNTTFFTWGIYSGIIGTLALYYLGYEYLHWCMHLPKKRQLEMSQAFRYINGHHLLHHRYMGKNFNVVLPFADMILGTLMIRSKIRFKQATGPMIPDVQPLNSAEPAGVSGKPAAKKLDPTPEIATAAPLSKTPAEAMAPRS